MRMRATGETRGKQRASWTSVGEERKQRQRRGDYKWECYMVVVTNSGDIVHVLFV